MTLLVVAGRTAPNRAVRFGGEHDPLDDRGRADVVQLRDELEEGRALLSGPELSVRQSAEVLGMGFDVASPLATLDVGRWSGLAPEALDPTELGLWFADPDAVPHGGESVARFVERIREAIARLDDDAALVVAKPVAQAATCASPAEFFATQIRPATVLRVP